MTASDHLSPVQFATQNSGFDAAPPDDTDYDFYTHSNTGHNDWDPFGDLQAPHYHPTSSPEVRRHAWNKANTDPWPDQPGARRFR